MDDKQSKRRFHHKLNVRCRRQIQKEELEVESNKTSFENVRLCTSNNIVKIKSLKRVHTEPIDLDNENDDLEKKDFHKEEKESASTFEQNINNVLDVYEESEKESASTHEQNINNVLGFENVTEEDTGEHFVSKVLKKYNKDCKPSHQNIDYLLKGFKEYVPDLPSSHKTLLKKKLCYNIEKFNPNSETDESKVVYFGMKEALSRSINRKFHKDGLIKLQFNIDGVSMFKSSTTEMWPILGKAYTDPQVYKPFFIQVWCGKGKPANVEMYLQKFVDELNELLKNGIEVQETRMKVEVMCFICDRPARSFIKCIKGHTGYHSCERCTETGYWLNNRLVFPALSSSKTVQRTDSMFRAQTDIGHHLGVSPLTSIEPKIDLVNQFPLDIMHLGYLGITKKLLTFWTTTTGLKLDKNDILKISARLANIASQIPYEFQRGTRSLGEIGKWKATEFRFFLLYCGSLVLRGILSEIRLKHFSLFSVACRILSSKDLFNVCQKHAAEYLDRFVKMSEILYKPDSIVSNMHSLTHVAEDVLNMKCPLSDISAFCFENKLGDIRKCLKSGYKPLEQLCARIEDDELSIEVNAGCSILSRTKSTSSIVNIKRVSFHNCELSCKEPNNAVLLKNGQIMLIEDITTDEKNKDKNVGDDVLLKGLQINIIGDAFVFPIKSSIMGIYNVNRSSCTAIPKVPLNSVKCKMVLLAIYEVSTDEKEWFAVPLLHM